MKYRTLGNTGLSVSEIGLGAEWLERHSLDECREIIGLCEENGINILDCWMAEPNVRTNIGICIKENRKNWYIQGHIGSTWQNNQYVKTRDMNKVKPAFEDLLMRLQTDYIDLGMIHFVDETIDYENIVGGDYLKYVHKLHRDGVIRHIGMSTHNPDIAIRAVTEGLVEFIMFSINPAFDLLPASEDINTLFAQKYDDGLSGIEPVRAKLYSLCERENVGITVMKPYAGGRLFSANTSAFGVALTPVQCIHYALTRPAVACVLAGYDTPAHVLDALAYETASDAQKDYASILANAPSHAYTGDCTYCGHCHPCPAGIDIAMVNKYLDLALSQPDLPAGIAGHYNDLEKKASDCIECGGCETRCPFEVHVIEKMNKAMQIFTH